MSAVVVLRASSMRLVTEACPVAVESTSGCGTWHE